MEKVEKFQIGNKFGYKDEQGKVVLPAEYDYVPWVLTQDNNEIVIKNHKVGLVNPEGKLIVDCLYDDIIPLSETLYAARLNDSATWSFGIFNIAGDKIVEFGNYKFVKRREDYIVCYKKCESKESCYTEKLYDYTNISESEWLDFKGHIICSGQAEDCINDCIIIKADGLYGFVNRSGTIVKPPIFSEIEEGVSGQLCVKQNKADGASWNVVSTEGEPIISEPYSYISNEGNFYKCIKDSQHESPIWINPNGKRIFTGVAKVLADTHLAIYNGNQWGVVNLEGRKILNYSYDSIDNIKDAIIILKNGKIGLVGWNGELIVAPSYNCIEFVNIHDKIYADSTFEPSRKQYGKYCLEFIFDTDESNMDGSCKLLRSQIYVKNGAIYTTNIDDIVFSNPIILRQDEYQEIFTLEEGTLSSSRYDEVKQLTNISFVVRKKEKYGVYRCDTKELIVGCGYDRIQFLGNHTVLIKKGRLWGAKSLFLPTSLMSLLCKVEIPCKYLDIKSIDKDEDAFSVKVEYKDYRAISHTEYRLVSRVNKDLLENSPKNRNLPVFESHFFKVTNQIYMTKSNEKYGFVHKSGYICIPFKYDELLSRKDGKTFDARIGNSWGIMTLDGKEIVPIKYSVKLPETYAYLEVTDSISGCKGILGEEGNEILPTIYDHIIPLGREQTMFEEVPDERADFYAVGFGGYLDEHNSNFFSDGIRYGIWGVVNNCNEPLVKVQYDCIKIIDGHFLCGRDGGFLYNSNGDCDHDYAGEYDGEYDVIDFKGNFIFGGCSGFHYDEELGLYFLKFGGLWQNECTYEDEWNNYTHYSWVYHEANSQWLVLDKDLNSIIPMKDGSTHKFPSDFHGKITTKRNKKGQEIQYWNMPLELFSVEYPEIKEGIMFYGEKGKHKAIRLRDKSISGEYSAVGYIDDFVYYYTYRVENDYYVGIGYYLPIDKQNNTGAISQEYHYILITKPVNGFCFTVTQDENDICDVYLTNIKETHQNPIKAISSIEQDDLFDAISKGKLLMILADGGEEMKDINVVDKTIFDESFVGEISQKEISQDGIQDKVPKYWYSIYNVKPKKKSFFQSRDYIEDEPYSWEDSMMDALDGQPDAYWNID